jgi:aspartate aminotransferase-like enzyme
MEGDSHVKLFIPGPVEVRPEIRSAQAMPMIGHRSSEYAGLQSRIMPKLRPVFGTQGRVFVVTASGSGLQEAAARNCVRERCLCMVNGAFSERWYEIVLANGKGADAVKEPWGCAIRPERVEEALRSGKYDAVTVVYNETSTGVFSPVPEIAAMMRAYPDVLLLVDAVSCAGGVEIRADEWGLDVCLTSSQKALALPPGLALCSVSDRAMQRAAGVPHRGWYFDFLEYDKYAAKNHTPATPAVSLMFALDAELDAIAAEGWPARFARHGRLMGQVHRWVEANGFEFFAEAGHRSPTVTAVKNSRGIDVGALNAYLRRRGMVISDGYGPLKGQTFRIAHMGDASEEDVAQLLDAMTAFLKGS